MGILKAYELYPTFPNLVSTFNAAHHWWKRNIIKKENNTLVLLPKEKNIPIYEYWCEMPGYNINELLSVVSSRTSPFVRHECLLAIKKWPILEGSLTKMTRNEVSEAALEVHESEMMDESGKVASNNNTAPVQPSA